MCDHGCVEAPEGSRLPGRKSVPLETVRARIAKPKNNKRRREDKY
jgi:hypothetical protein